MGVPLVFRPQANAGHDTSWWPYERGLFEQFVKQKPRVAHPARVSWETERIDRFNRADWLIIDRLGPGTSEASFEADLDIFEHKRRRVASTSSGPATRSSRRAAECRQFTLLLSPDAIDFAQPVTVNVNGKEVFDGTLKRMWRFC